MYLVKKCMPPDRHIQYHIFTPLSDIANEFRWKWDHFGAVYHFLIHVYSQCKFFLFSCSLVKVVLSLFTGNDNLAMANQALYNFSRRQECKNVFVPYLHPDIQQGFLSYNPVEKWIYRDSLDAVICDAICKVINNL